MVRVRHAARPRHEAEATAHGEAEAGGEEALQGHAAGGLLAGTFVPHAGPYEGYVPVDGGAGADAGEGQAEGMEGLEAQWDAEGECGPLDSQAGYGQGAYAHAGYTHGGYAGDTAGGAAAAGGGGADVSGLPSSDEVDEDEEDEELGAAFDDETGEEATEGGDPLPLEDDGGAGLDGYGDEGVVEEF